MTTYSTGVCRKRRRERPSLAALMAVAAWIVFVPAASQGQMKMTLQTAAGGAMISGLAPSYSINAGGVNGLGVGTPSAAITVISSGITGGVIYSTPYSIVLGGGIATGDVVNVSAYVQINFPSTSIAVYSCQTGGSCSTASGYTAMSLNAASPTTVVPNGTVYKGVPIDAFVGLKVAAANGASAFIGAQSATVTLVATDITKGNSDSVSLTITATGQTAVQFTLATAAGGVTLSPATDYAMNFGFVNGLGVGTPVSGATVLNSAGGVIYGTPYLLQPSFSNSTSTTATLSVQLGLNFVHPAALALRDAPVSAGPYSAITAAPTVLTTSATSGANITRYIGLFVAAINGATAYAGSDSAKLTYTMVVP